MFRHILKISLFQRLSQQRSSSLTTSIPVVDVSALMNCSSSFEQHPSSSMIKASKLFSEALRQYGFVYIKNSHVTPLLVEETLLQSRWLFSQSEELKSKNLLTSNCHRGYYKFTSACVDDKIEAYSICRDIEQPYSLKQDYFQQLYDNDEKQLEKIKNQYNQINKWPPMNSEFKRIMLDYWLKCQKTSTDLLWSLAKYLNLEDPSIFIKQHSKHDNNMEIKYYPKLETKTKTTSEQMLRFPVHCDLTTLTLLCQDRESGLEIYNQNTNTWIAAPSTDDSILVNCGDLMEIWSNYYYPSTKHRVIQNTNNDKSDRISIVYFVFPNYETEIAPIQHQFASQTTTKNSDFEPFQVGDRMPFLL
ncbi:unnamed protein product [Didymodactylos carnosus]|uniref:Fe2OG dioxygenase domain-containing protein n=1 Tax=Didymodactylos carnosus TaxID=1234261 RepID=A0A8S2DTM7_9BILA|nr:unnamed protein product [Didymodactylos carnosus]CAF3769129.1 unnamed protein product [Didymodactylos carnosus]